MQTHNAPEKKNLYLEILLYYNSLSNTINAILFNETFVYLKQENSTKMGVCVCVCVETYLP